MKPMTGELGVLYQDNEQVGWIKYWTAIYNRDTHETIIRASQYKFLQDVDKGEFDIEFYVKANDELESVHKAKATISLPARIPGKVYNRVIELNLGAFEWEPMLVRSK